MASLLPGPPLRDPFVNDPLTQAATARASLKSRAKEPWKFRTVRLRKQSAGACALVVPLVKRRVLDDARIAPRLYKAPRSCNWLRFDHHMLRTCLDAAKGCHILPAPHPPPTPPPPPGTAAPGFTLRVTPDQNLSLSASPSGRSVSLYQPSGARLRRPDGALQRVLPCCSGTKAALLASPWTALVSQLCQDAGCIFIAGRFPSPRRGRQQYQAYPTRGGVAERALS